MNLLGVAIDTMPDPRGLLGACRAPTAIAVTPLRQPAADDWAGRVTSRPGREMCGGWDPGQLVCGTCGQRLEPLSPIDRGRVGWTATARSVFGSGDTGIVVGSFRDRIDLLTSSGLQTHSPKRITYLSDNVAGTCWTPAGALYEVAFRLEAGKVPHLTGISGGDSPPCGGASGPEEPDQRRGLTDDVVRLGRPEAASLVGTQSLAAALLGTTRIRESRWGEALAAFAELPQGRYRHLLPEVVAAGAGAGPSSLGYQVARSWVRSLPSHPLAVSAIDFFDAGHTTTTLLNALAAHT